jgi:RND family efflux transporter MFP subunit
MTPPSARPVPSSRAWLALALAAPLLLAGCFEDADAADAAAVSPDVPTVRLATVGEAASFDTRRFVGRVEARSTVDLAFQLTGEIVDLAVRQGEIVPQGGRIAGLDPTDYRLALDRAEANRDLAEAEFNRARDLVERGAAPEARLDQTRADLALAEVEIRSAERNIGLTTIEAPFDALITRRLTDAFAYVTPGTPVVRVQDVTEMRVVISVPEDLIWLAGQPETFTAGARLTALPELAFPLVLREFATEADAVARTYEVSFAIDAPRDPRVLPGMTATVELRANGAAAPAGFELPVAAIDPNGSDGFQVWVFDPEAGTVAPRAVTLGLPDADRVPVLEGLEPGEQVVAAGVGRLVPGQRVRPLDL